MSKLNTVGDRIARRILAAESAKRCSSLRWARYQGMVLTRGTLGTLIDEALAEMTTITTDTSVRIDAEATVRLATRPLRHDP